MGFSDTQKYQLWRVKRLFDGLDKELRKQGEHDIAAFDSIASDALCLILNRCVDDGHGKAPAKSVKLSSYTISKIVHSTRGRVRCRLDKLAQYGLIKTHTSWRNDGSNKRNTMEITPHPWLFYLLAVGAKPAHKAQAIKQFVGLGVSRMESEEPVQGFKYDVPLGQPEPEEVEAVTGAGVDEETEDKLNEMIAQENASKAQKQREASAWRAKSDDFVAGSAKLWQYAQQQLGYGKAAPSWAGDRKLLAPACSRERQELVKIFQQYGARVTALAWYVFAGGIPEFDDKTGRPKFTINAPHRQYASTDRRPSQFAKYFNSILNDGFFQKFATTDWGTIEPALRSFYDGILDQQPRDGGDDQERAGITFGAAQQTNSERMEVSL